MEKINKIRQLFKNKNIDGYIICKNDEFFGEYIFEGKDKQKYISNFSGSFGFAIIFETVTTYLQMEDIPRRARNRVVKIEKQLHSKDDRYFKNKIHLGFDPKIITKKF